MASFRRYKNKSDNKTYWEYRIRYKDPITQKYKEASKRGFPTKKEAQIAAYEVEQKIDNRIMPNAHNLTFGEVYNEWWANHSKTVKQSTRYTKTSKFNAQILPFFGNMKIKEITNTICQEFINRLDEQVESVNDFKIQANLVFKYAKRKGYINVNPMEDVIIPKKQDEFLAVADEDEERNFFYKDEKNEFLKIVKNEMSVLDYFMIYMLLNFGMRKGELLALEWKDVQLKDRYIKINKTLFFEDGKEVIQKTKNYATRDLPIGEKQLKTLKRWKIQQRELLLAAGVREEPKYVLCRNDLRPLRLAFPNDELNKFYKKHPKFHRVTVHGLRHTFASIAFEAGADPKEVQELLGHKDIQTTMNVYVHVTKFKKEKAIEKINRIMDEM